MQCGGDELIVGGRLLRIAHPGLDKYNSISEPEAVIADLRKSHAPVDIFTFMQIMPDVTQKYDYPMEMDNLAILPVSTYENWFNNQIRSYPRNRSRQAEKRGVILREVPFDEQLAKGIWEVYQETKVRQGKPNRHYGKDVETVRREAATYLDRSIFIGAYLEGQLIGFVKLVTDLNRCQASLMNIASMVRHRDRATTNALIAHSVRACASRNIPYLMYQHFVYGNRDADSMTHFKEINGFHRVDLPRYYVPLTLRGKVAMKYNLHRGLTNVLPMSVVARLRQLRNSWYNRKLQSETEAT